MSNFEKLREHVARKGEMKFGWHNGRPVVCERWHDLISMSPQLLASPMAAYALKRDGDRVTIKVSNGDAEYRIIEEGDTVELALVRFTYSEAPPA